MADRYPLHPAAPAALLSPQVVGSRYIFPDLAPRGKVAWTLALAGREECRPDYCVDRPGYPFTVLELVAGGRGEVRLGSGRSRPLATGSVFVAAADEPCRIRTAPEAPLVKFFFALHGSEVRRRLDAAGLRPGTVRHLPMPAEAVATAEDIIREGRRHHPAARAIGLKLVELLLLRLAAARAAAGGPEDDRAWDGFVRAKALIDERAAGWRTLEDVAEALRIDPSSVCRLFRRFQGVSPYQYLLRRKMALAAEALLDEGVLVKEAAARVGFEDPYHFSRCFKAVHGLSPAALRRLARGAGSG